MTERLIHSDGLLTAVPAPEAEVDRETLTATLFYRIGQCGDEDEAQTLREQVVSINMQIAKSLARRYFGHGENNDDLKQVAYLGLTKAAAGFDPSRGGNFLSYAVPTITGELKKHFRDRCWTVRPPRRIQDLQRQITSAREVISRETHHQATIHELAAKLEVSAEQISEAGAAQGCFTPTSLDVPLKNDTTTTFADLLQDDNRDLEQSEAHLLLAPLVKSLPESDRQILSLRFFEEWTQEQIAQSLGTSQTQISRRLSRLMLQLRQRVQTNRHCV